MGPPSPQGQSVENRPNISVIVVCDVVEHNSFLIVESNMNVPLLPVNDPSIDFERDTIRLCDIYWLDILPIAPFRLNTGWVVVIRFRLTNWSADFRDIDVNDFLLVGIEDRAEIEGK